MTERIVPVKTWLTPDVHRELLGHAQLRGVTVGELLTQLAERSLRPQPRYTRITDRMIEATRTRLDRGETLSAIAAGFGCSRLGLHKALRRKERS